MKHFAPLLFLLAVFITACNSVTTVAYNLPEREANEIVVLLSNRGIGAQKSPVAASSTGTGSTEQMWNITVPSKNITQAIAALNQAGLPRTKGTSLLDLFGAQGLVPSELQNKIRYQEGLSEQLSTTIKKMDGIIDAVVQITFPQDEEANIPMTASVYVKHRGVLDNPNSLTITKIKRLVSSALPGLQIDNVSVVTDRALLSDLPLNESDLHQEHEYVSIWGVVVAKQSVSLFRSIFYFFLVGFFILACALIWLVWKIYPLLKTLGFPTLLNPMPYELAGNVAPVVEKQASAPEDLDTKELESKENTPE